MTDHDRSTIERAADRLTVLGDAFGQLVQQCNGELWTSDFAQHLRALQGEALAGSNELRELIGPPVEQTQ